VQRRGWRKTTREEKSKANQDQKSFCVDNF